MDTSEMTDGQWDRLRPLLPPQQPATGRPAKDHRRVINGMLWVPRTGSPRRAPPERFGSWTTVSSRCYRRLRAGMWDRVLLERQRRADAGGRRGWTLHLVDGTVVRAHRHAAEAAAGSRRRSASGASGAASRWCRC